MKSFLPSVAGDVEGLLRHATDVLELELLLARHRRDVDVRRVRRDPVDREGLEHVLEAHAVVGFLPHLLREVERALGRRHVRVHAERERLVDEQLVRVEVRHQERHRVTLLVGHLLEVRDVFAELDLVREPRVRHGLVVQVHRPLVLDRLEEEAVLQAGSENSHAFSLRFLLAAVALQEVHWVDRHFVLRYDVERTLHQLSAFGARPPNPRRCGAAAGAAVDVDAAASTGTALLWSMSSDLFTFTVDCSAVWRGFMCR